MLSSKADAPTVLVTDAGRGSAIAIIRSLGRKGLRVIAADAAPNSLGFHSRFAADRLVYPNPEKDPHAFVEALLQAARSQKIGLIIPVTDAAILPLSDAREQFEGVCQLSIPERSMLEVVTNKLKTLELAHQQGIPAPLTRLVYSREEALREAAGFHWPIVLKPLASRKLREGKGIESFTVSYASNAGQLADQMNHFEGRCPVLLQEYTPGEGCGIELLSYQGRPLAAFQHRRLREIPINGGASALRESVPLDPLMYEYATRMMAALCWTGLAMVEFKLGKDGPKLMEINGRVWGSLPLAVLSGMDFPGHLVDLYFTGQAGDLPLASGSATTTSSDSRTSAKLPVTGQATAWPKPSTDYRVGVLARNLELDVIWILTVLKGKKRYPFLPMPGRAQAVKAVLQLLNPRYRNDILSWDDPLPGLHELVKIVRKIGAKMKEAG